MPAPPRPPAGRARRARCSSPNIAASEVRSSLGGGDPMTSEREAKLQGVVENLWFKLISRASMIVLATLVTAGAPVVWSIMQRSYDAFGQLRDVQIKQQAQIERQEFSQAVDRSAL